MTQALTSTASSSNVALVKAAPSGLVAPSSFATVYNSGAADIAVKFGTGSGLAAVMPIVGTPGDYVVPKGGVAQVPVPPNSDHVAAIGVGTIYITTGF